MSFLKTRGNLANNFRTIVANVYDYPPPSPLTPCIVFVPSNPYIEPIGLGNGRYWARFDVTVAVNGNDNKAGLANIETLCTAVMEALPQGATVNGASAPRFATLGTAEVIVSEMTVEVIVNEG